MPVQRGKVGLFSKYGNKAVEAFRKHKGDETEYSNFGELPPGIDGGIAQLVDCRVIEIKEGKQNAGQLMFFARGIVVEPDEAVDPRSKMVVRIKGRGTSLSEPLFDTPGRSRESQEEHIAHMENELRKLGLSTDDIEETDEELEAALKLLVDSAPYFRFRTWGGDATPEYPNPRVNHQWEGVVPDYTPPEAEASVQDDTAPAAAAPPPRPTPNGPPRTPAASARPTTRKPPTPTPAAKTPAAVPPRTQPAAEGAAKLAKAPVSTKSKAPPPKAEAEPVNEFTGEPDLDSLAAAADDGDADAMANLEELAERGGVEQDKVTSAASWADVASMIARAGAEPDGGADSEGDGDGTGQGGEGDAEWVPQEKDVYRYFPIDPKTKKPSKRHIDVEVTAVDARKRTVTVKSYDDPKGKPILNVKWDDLKSE